MLLSSILLTAGCSSLTIAPKADLLAGTTPPVYSDTDWAAVLQTHVRGGLVDYEALSRDIEPLQRYYALISRTGPSSTPDQFTSRNEVLAYWLNAYNALWLLAAVQNYPAASVYDLTLPSIEFEYNFQVDRENQTLASIENRILQESDGDVRGLLATARAALGTPKLNSEPIRAATLDQQLADAAADALDDPYLLRIDHQNQSILLWQLILRRQDDFLNYWRNHRRVETAWLLNVLQELASPRQRQALQTAVGYAFREIPFDRTLNALQRPASRPSP